MVNYSNKTLGDTYNAIVNMMGKYRTPENTDWASIVSHINRAIREAVYMTLPFKDNAYIYNMDAANLTVLPQGYIDKVRVILSANGNPPYREARYVDVKEWYALTDNDWKHSWNQYTINEPIYCLWGPDTGASTLVLRVYPTTYSGIMEYYQCPDLLTDDADLLPVPYDYEDYIIYSALSRIYSRVAVPALFKQIQSQATYYRNIIAEKYKEKRMTSERQLDRFDDPVPPFATPPPEPDEAPQRLV